MLLKRLSTTITQHADHVKINWKDKSAIFHYCWLKDNCSSAIHKSTKQKLISSGQIPFNVKPEKVEWKDEKLHISWNSHSSVFDSEYLRKYDYSTKRRHLIQPIHWDAKEYQKKYRPIDYTVFMNTDDGIIKALMDLRDYGLVFLRNVPIGNVAEVENVAKRFGTVQNTFYGPSWDVKSILNSKNIAYTSLYLGLHMDLMYFESPPGLQMLHCLENTVKGGESLFVDSFKAVEILKSKHEQDYLNLCQIPVTFHYQNDGHYRKFTRPTIIPNDINDGVKVYYAPPFQGPLEAEPRLVPKFYESFAKFESIIQQPEMTFKLLLKPGDCVIFLNQRVLHGREAFDSTTGTRHLRGTYVISDDFKNMLRVHSLGSE